MVKDDDEPKKPKPPEPDPEKIKPFKKDGSENSNKSRNQSKNN